MLPLNLARARTEVEAAFAGSPDQRAWLSDASSSDLVNAGLQLVLRIVNGDR